MKKSQKNMPLLWGSLLMLVIVIIAVVVNYIGNLKQLSDMNAVGLQLTDGEENYICDKDYKLIVEITGSEKNLKDRTANATYFPDDFNGPAQAPNMKLKEVVDGATRYVYKENSLVIDKDGKATLYIYNKMLKDPDHPRDVPVAANCVKVGK